jgi:hypothetical protein
MIFGKRLINLEVCVMNYMAKCSIANIITNVRQLNNSHPYMRWVTLQTYQSCIISCPLHDLDILHLLAFIGGPIHTPHPPSLLKFTRVAN